jgi:hypothetical protein
VNFTDVFVAWYGKISGFNKSSINMFPLNLSHLFFISNSEKFADKLRIDSNNLDYFMPELEELTSHLVHILHKLESNLVRILQVNSLRKRNYSTAPSLVIQY